MTIYPVIFQGANPELHYAGTGTTPKQAEEIAHKHMHRVKLGVSLHIVQATVGEEGYTNFVDYKLNEDGTIERHIFGPNCEIVPERDSKMRPIIPVRW